MVQDMRREVGIRSVVKRFAFSMFGLLFALAAHAQSQDLTPAEASAAAGISLVEIAQAPILDVPEEIDDGSFEVLNKLRQTVLANGQTYGDWEVFSRSAKNQVANGTEETEAYDELRARLVVWRDLFLDNEDLNASRVSTLNAQLLALGAAPNGTEESGEVSDVAEIIRLRRAALEKERAILNVPSLASSEAYQLATGLIREIDRIVASRTKTEFLKPTTPPVLPAYWAEAAEYLYGFVAIIPAETRVAWHKDERREDLRGNLPQLLLYLALAMVILLRFDYWSQSLLKRVDVQKNASLRWIVSFVLSTLSTIAPLVALLLVFETVSLTGMLGSHGIALMDGMRSVVVLFFVGRWLGIKVFPKEGVGVEIFTLTPSQRVEGRLYSSLLGALLGCRILLEGFFDLTTSVEAVFAVLMYPVTLSVGLLCFRLAQLIRNGVVSEDDTDDLSKNSGRGFRNQVVTFVGRLIMVPAVLGPVLATFGYYNAAVMLTYPVVPALALLAFILVLQRVANEIYDIIARRNGASGDAILPVLVGFVLALGSLPIFAMILGVPAAQILDYWTLFLNGITVGSTRISPSNLFMFFIAFGAGYMLTRLVQGALRSSLLPKTKLDIGGQNAIVSGLGYVGVFLAGLAAITAAGIDLSAFAIVAGALSVGIGFGLQNIVSNFVSGIILLVERPISEGDWIEVGGQMGYVRDISVRSTRIETFDRTDVIIPNGDLVAGVVTNWTRGNSVGRLVLPVGVSYDEDSKRVEEILLEVAMAHPMVLATPAPSALFVSFGDSSLNFEVRAILRDVNWKLTVASDLNHEILKRFNAEGISIPFPQSDIWLRNAQELRGPGLAERPAEDAPTTLKGGTSE
jgi:small-conductance mechanosensitive channel